MWTKLWETIDGHDSGRWQWFTDIDPNAQQTAKVALPCEISDGRRGWCFPGVWMSSEAICVPPGGGQCITNIQEVERNQIVMSTR
jgi:hypothetical protein